MGKNRVKSAKGKQERKSNLG